MADIHFLYQFPIQYLLQILSFVLSANPPPTPAPAPKDRIQVGRQKAKMEMRFRKLIDCLIYAPTNQALKEAILSEVSRRVSKGLLQEDQLAFAVRLTQIYLQGTLTTYMVSTKHPLYLVVDPIRPSIVHIQVKRPRRHQTWSWITSVVDHL